MRNKNYLHGFSIITDDKIELYNQLDIRLVKQLIDTINPDKFDYYGIQLLNINSF